MEREANTTSGDSSAPCPPIVTLVHFCDNHGPVNLLATCAVPRVGCTWPSRGLGQACASCHILKEDERRILTEEKGTKRVWASASPETWEAAVATEFIPLLRRVALRALSFENGSSDAEENAGNTVLFKVGPLSVAQELPHSQVLYTFFQEHDRCFALAKSFRLKDRFNVRGFRRTYGIIVLASHSEVLMSVSSEVSILLQSLIAKMQVRRDLDCLSIIRDLQLDSHRCRR
jgi:hypothetical protein